MASTHVAVAVAAPSVVGMLVMPLSKMVLPQDVSGFARTVPMALVPAGSAPARVTLPILFPPAGSALAIEPTSSRPLESICSDSVFPLVTVGRVELNDPPTRVTEPGCAAARAPTEAFDPPPPDCCICACVLFHTLP